MPDCGLTDPEYRQLFNERAVRIAGMLSEDEANAEDHVGSPIVRLVSQGRDLLV